MTSEPPISQTLGKAAPKNSAKLDPRIRAFVRMLARRSAEEDFRRYEETFDKAHNPDETRE